MRRRQLRPEGERRLYERRLHGHRGLAQGDQERRHRPFLSGITKASIVTKLNHFETATKQLVSQIKAVPAPNTSWGREAREAREVDRELITGAQAQSDYAEKVTSTIATGA
jgi:hypothetical protein